MKGRRNIKGVRRYARKPKRAGVSTKKVTKPVKTYVKRAINSAIETKVATKLGFVVAA